MMIIINHRVINNKQKVSKNKFALFNAFIIIKRGEVDDD